ncbi:MAG: porin [Rikenellaceae bacterium]
MNISKLFSKYALGTILILSLSTTIAQEQATPSTEVLLSELNALKDRLDTIESENKRELYTPQLYGAMMAYFNLNTDTGDQRFAVRYAQLGVKGQASQNMSYVIHINFHNLAKVTVLDSYMRYTDNKKRFDLTLGQQWIHLTSDFDRCGAKPNLLTSRSYGVVFITDYSTGSGVSELSNRDIGLYGNYTFKGEIPITLSLGLFNGEGKNVIVWDNDINVTGRVQFGSSKGLAGGASVYTGTTPLDQDITIWSGELRYVANKFFIETNYQQRHLESDDSSSPRIAQTGLIQGYYKISNPDGRVFDSYVPTIRYDFGDNIDYYNTLSQEVEQQNAGRISAFMHFMLKGAKIKSRFSIGYEKVLMSNRPSDIETNSLLQDRFTVATTVAF